MSNARSFRRKLKVVRTVPARTAAPDPLERRPPWNKGLTLTGTPSATTVRRQLRRMEAMGIMEHATERTGKPGRPPHLWSVTGEGKALYDIGCTLRDAGYDTSVLTPEQADVLISFGYAAREGDRVVFLEDYQEAWKFWRSKKDADPPPVAARKQTAGN